MAGELRLFVCGDVMLGRGVDQIQQSPGDPGLRESWVRDARRYVEMAEQVNGPIPRPVDAAWVWGAALDVIDAAAPHVRIVNLETSITTSPDFARGKAVHYRMSPDNVDCLTALRPDVCALANNHVLDFGAVGLHQTLHALRQAGIRSCGAGRDLEEARRPVAVPLTGAGRCLIWSTAFASSGVPSSWAASDSGPGVDLHRRTSTAADIVVAEVRRHKRPGDVAVVSVHWGSNWGWDVGREQVGFAHRVIDGGVDLVHGHSSHHPRPLEVYRDRLVLYGCGDFIDDYEGITGYEEYRDDLRLAFLPSLEPGSGRLRGLRVVPLQVRRMSLVPATREDAEWTGRTLNRISGRFGTGVNLDTDGDLVLAWGD